MELEDLETEDPSDAVDVAIALVKQAREDPFIRERVPGVQVYAAIALLPSDNCPMVRLALHSLACYLNCGVSSADWVSTCKQRARMGHTFRAVFHWEYKANRGLTPRITNRGGQLPVRPPAFTERTPFVNEQQRDKQGDTADGGDRLDQRDATKRQLRLSDLAR